jgi:hydrogenase/urease accessory protein HupE
MRILTLNRFMFLFLALVPGVALADNSRIEYVGGTIEQQRNGDVALVLDIYLNRLSQVARIPMGRLDTWGDLRRREGALQESFRTQFKLRVKGRETAPTEVSIPALATQPNQAPLPKFISVSVVWRKVNLARGAFTPNLVEAKSLDAMTSIHLVLEEKMPWWQVLPRSILIGFEHILPFGLDHILFVLGIYLAASRFRDLLWQVTSFTVAHSITLGLTMSGVLIVGPFWEQFVEIGIAVSIFFVAFENCWSRKSPGWGRILIVGGFGLIHGMGFAGRLAEVRWPPGTFYLTLFGANLGIELGQLAVIGVASLLTAWWWKCPWYQSRIAIPLSLLIGLYGMFAALDRLSQLRLPRREVLDFFWNLYDKYEWAIPFSIGVGVLVITWIIYRIILALIPQKLQNPI